MQATDKAPFFDKLPLSDEAVSKAQTIGIEILESSIKHIKTRACFKHALV